MTSEKRGTSAEYGQEKLRERAAQNAGDETPVLRRDFLKNLEYPGCRYLCGKHIRRIYFNEW
jgi:hypothetical protein